MDNNYNSHFARILNKYILSPIRLKSLSIRSPQGAQIIERVYNENLSYLEPLALIDLFEAVQSIENNHYIGLLIEAGCALGGSALVMTSAKSTERQLKVYDTFAMIPPPSESDEEDSQNRYKIISSGKAKGIKGEEYYGYVDNLLDRVKNSFSQFGMPIENHNVDLIPGLFQDTLRLNQPVALAHLDCDWYDSVLTCLQRIEPNLIHGGRLIVDDYQHWSGCRKAVDKYFENKRDQYIFSMKSRLHIIKR